MKKPVFYPDLPKLDPHDAKAETMLVSECWASQLVKGRAVLVRSGFETDGASIPRAFWRLIGHPWMQWVLPHALPHDALYASELFPRKECDAFLLDSLALAGVSWWRRNAVWLGVRIGGGSAWSRHTEASKAEARRRVLLLAANEYAALKRLSG